MVIDHICFAVKNVDEGIADWGRVFGYKQRTEVVANSRQEVKVVFLSKEDSLTVKLIEPLEQISLASEVCPTRGWFPSYLFQMQ